MDEFLKSNRNYALSLVFMVLLLIFAIKINLYIQHYGIQQTPTRHEHKQSQTFLV